MPEIRVTLPLKLVNPLNSRRHWRPVAKTAKTNRTATRMVIAAEIRKTGIKVPVDITMTRVSAGTMDFSGVVASQKPIEDGIADAFGIDDRDPRLKFHYEQRKGSRGQYAVEIVIVERVA